MTVVKTGMNRRDFLRGEWEWRYDENMKHKRRMSLLIQ